MIPRLLSLFTKPKSKSLPEKLADHYENNPDVIPDAIHDHKGARSTIKDTLIEEVDAAVNVNGKVDHKKAQELVEKVNAVFSSRKDEAKVRHRKTGTN